MSEYREGCIKHKAVQRGIIDQRAVPNTKKKLKGDWLRVQFYSGQWHVWGEYVHEEDARKNMIKMNYYTPRYFIVERDVFDRSYRHLKI